MDEAQCVKDLAGSITKAASKRWQAASTTGRSLCRRVLSFPLRLKPNEHEGCKHPSPDRGIGHSDNHPALASRVYQSASGPPAVSPVVRKKDAPGAFWSIGLTPQPSQVDIRDADLPRWARPELDDRLESGIRRVAPLRRSPSVQACPRCAPDAA